MKRESLTLGREQREDGWLCLGPRASCLGRCLGPRASAAPSGLVPTPARRGLDIMPSAPMTRTLSHYRLESEIGRGGMGVVYRAVDTRLGRTVAIKMLPPEATADPDRHKRFVQEARSASALNHPHIVTIYDIDEDGGHDLHRHGAGRGHAARSDPRAGRPAGRDGARVRRRRSPPRLRLRTPTASSTATSSRPTS